MSTSIDENEPLELKPIEIHIRTNFYDDKSFILTKNYLEFNDTVKSKKSKSKKSKMSELPYFSINYELPEILIFETYTSNKRISLFFRKKKLQDIILKHNKPIKVDDDDYDVKIRQNVMIMIKCLFPTTYPVVDNHFDSLNYNILEGTAMSNDNFYSYITQSITKLFNSNKMFMNIDGSIYTPYRVTFLNDIVNHPIYGEIIRDIGGISNKLKKENENTLNENIFLLKERIYSIIISINRNEANIKTLQSFISRYLRQTLNPNQVYGLNYNYLEQLQQAVKLVMYIVLIFTGKYDPNTYQQSLDDKYKELERIYNNRSSNANYNTHIIKSLDDYVDTEFRPLLTAAPPIAAPPTTAIPITQNEIKCVRQIVFRNNLTFVQLHDSSKRDKILSKLNYLKDEDYKDCSGVGFFSLNSISTNEQKKNFLYQLVINYIEEVEEKNKDYKPLLDDIFQNNVFKDIPRASNGIFFQLISLLTDFRDLTILKSVKSVYFDKTDTLIEDENDRFNELVKKKYQEYDYTLGFNTKIKKLIKPNRESTNNQLKYILETYNNDNTVIDFLEKAEKIYNTYILLKPRTQDEKKMELESYGNILDVGVSHYNFPTEKPKFEIYLQMDLFEGKLTSEVEKKIRCIFQNDSLGELYEYLVSADKNKYIVRKGKMFSIPKLLSYVGVDDDKTGLKEGKQVEESKPVKQGGKKTKRKKSIKQKLRRTKRRHVWNT